MDFFTGGSNIMDYGQFGQKKQFGVKNILMMDLILTNTQLLASQSIDWRGVDY